MSVRHYTVSDKIGDFSLQKLATFLQILYYYIP